MRLPLPCAGSQELAACVGWLGKEETAHSVALVGGERGQAVPHPRSLAMPKEAVRGRVARRVRMRGKELPLVLSRGHSKVTALAGSIWAPAGGK